MGRLWSIQGLPALSCHGIVETPRGVDFSFRFFLDLHDLCVVLALQTRSACWAEKSESLAGTG